MGSDSVEIEQNSAVILKELTEFTKLSREILAKNFLLKIKGTKDETTVSKMVDGGKVRSKDFYEGAERIANITLKRFQVINDKVQIRVWSVIIAYICYRLVEKEENSVIVTNKKTEQPYVT